MKTNTYSLLFVSISLVFLSFFSAKAQAVHPRIEAGLGGHDLLQLNTSFGLYQHPRLLLAAGVGFLRIKNTVDKPGFIPEGDKPSGGGVQIFAELYGTFLPGNIAPSYSLKGGFLLKEGLPLFSIPSIGCLFRMTRKFSIEPSVGYYLWVAPKHQMSGGTWMANLAFHF